jgi:hypothetical protein
LRETRQIFDKGLNERLPGDRQTPDRLGKLQNARLTKRGQTFFVSRMEGAIGLLNYQDQPYVVVKDNLSVEGEMNTTGFNRGYLVRFTDSVGIDEDNNLGVDLSDIKHSVTLEDKFVFKVIPLQEFMDYAGVSETFLVKTLPVLRFVDAVSTADTVTIPNRFTLTFSDSVDVLAYDPLCQDP